MGKLKLEEMKTIKICCNNGANIHSKRTENVPVTELTDSEDSWYAMTNEEKQKATWDWVMERCWIDVWYEEE